MSPSGEGPEVLEAPRPDERRRLELAERERRQLERAQRAEAAAREQQRRHEQRASRDRAEREQQLHRDAVRERRRARARARAAAGGMVGAVAAPPTSGGPKPPSQPQDRPRIASREGEPAAPPPPPRSPAPRPPGSTEPKPQHPSLKGPTARAAAALAAVAAFALGAGWLLGLPLPVLGDPEGQVEAEPASAQPLIRISAGTPIGLTEGPYHPVVLEDPDYGEGPARFGAPRSGRRHEGQDVFARPGTPLVAVRDGIVLDGGGGRSFYSYGGGNTFVMYSPIDDRSYVYLHMLKPALVEAGKRVKAGQLIGRVGCTGSCDGPHLHFEVREGRAVYGPQKKAVDPLPLMKRWPVRPAG